MCRRCKKVFKKTSYCFKFLQVLIFADGVLVTSTRLSQSATVDLRPVNESTRAYTPQNLFRHTVVACAKFVSNFQIHV